MKANIKRFVYKWYICQRMKYESTSPVGLLQPLPIPTEVWKDILMDFIKRLPKAGQVDTILVVVDWMTKYEHFLSLRPLFTAAEVAQKFIQEVVKLHGFSCSIVLDRDRVFLSQFWGEIFRATGIKLKFSSSYYPQTDGQTEAINRSLENYLWRFCFRQPWQWPKWISWVEY